MDWGAEEEEEEEEEEAEVEAEGMEALLTRQPLLWSVFLADSPPWCARRISP